jgi:hypothetical protein
MNPVRDDTTKALQYRHLSAIITELVNGLDSCLRRNDKRFHTASYAGMTMVERKQREKWGNACMIDRNCKVIAICESCGNQEIASPINTGKSFY